MTINPREGLSRRIQNIIEPAKRYVKGVVDRELANAATGRFDAGELAFAAASCGATTDWKQNERLRRACELLIEALPDSGSLPTRRPFHSTPRGYRLLPIGCEMTRSLAQLLQRTNFEFDPKTAQRMLNIFEEKRIDLSSSTSQDRPVGWNFEGAPRPDRPCVWVTSVAVLALDRIVRMLNERINACVLRHFEVIRPERPHTQLRLNDLLYPDYGFSERFLDGCSVALRLEQMRAHIMRATLPAGYEYAEGSGGRLVSIILYGPPGTGKTTLPESLALSSNVPLVRLSPSDLTAQGHELIEGRARSVFEALSMLTQSVILLDEFEPVLGSRAARPGGQQASNPVFNFLLTGMLPKLLKLNEAAQKQSLGYFLATNYINNIDRAAKREGRFDLKIPIYHPDPLARAGELLYRLNRADGAGGDHRLRDRETELAFMRVVSNSSDKSAGNIAREYAKLSWDDVTAAGARLVEGGTPAYPPDDPRRRRDKQREMSKEEREEIEHLDWLENWENEIRDVLREQRKGVQHILDFCLEPPAKGRGRR